MTQAFDGQVTPSASVHNAPPSLPGAQLPSIDQLLYWGQSIIEGVVNKVVLAIVGVVVPGPIIDQLHYWADTLLPSFILQPIYDLVDLLVSLLGPIPIVGSVVYTLANYFGLLHNNTTTAQATGDTAQASADNANVGVARLEGRLAVADVPGGVIFDDTFDRGGGNLGADYSQGNSGPATGTLSTDGNRAILIPGGAGQTYCTARILTPLATDYQAISIIQDSAFRGIISPGQIDFYLRANAAGTESVSVSLTLGAVILYKTVGGAGTALASVTDYGGPGDKWTLKVGTDVDDREFIVYHNTAEIIRVTDTSGTLSAYGPSNVYAGLNELSALNYIPPFFTSVEIPPAIQAITAYDRLPAA